ncbi:MAG: hemolysin III family protein [Gammaproteobacteria bacterium]|nr:hemolysin III family protein [Gammaproteobacteria bacterium]
MKDNQKVKYYSPLEERINISSHALGFVLSIIALILLFIRASVYGSVLHIISFSIFGISLIVLYAASTLYHRAKDPELRSRLRVFDHVSIYVLIAGTYTPFALITLKGELGWIVFSISWGLALTGIILKLFFTGKYNLISTLMYLFLGWMVIFFINPLMDSLSSDGFIWLAAGGLSYTVGAVLYSIKKIPFNHALFHVFVLLGSFAHFVSVYFYVLP